jgi:hypothetical protein
MKYSHFHLEIGAANVPMQKLKLGSHEPRNAGCYKDQKTIETGTIDQENSSLHWN